VTRRCSIFCYPLRLPRTPKMEPQVAVQLNSRRQTDRDSQDICSAALELRLWDYLSLPTPKAQGPRFEHCASPQPSRSDIIRRGCASRGADRGGAA
jgi:hypothetical protein